MTTVQDALAGKADVRLPAGPIAAAVDRWIYVFMAAFFVAVVLTGFIPDSLAKIAAVEARQRPPFPLVLHLHAVLMGSFLLLLLAQTGLAAAGRTELHRRLGLAAFVLAPALVVVGFVLVPTTYHSLWNAAQAAPPGPREQLQQTILLVDNIMLLQLRVGVLFPLFLAVGLWARTRDAGMHKRMMVLAIASAIPAGIDRIAWLPTTMPASPLATDLYTLLAVAPLFVWDLIRERRVHPAFAIWLAVNLPLAVAVNTLWGTPLWHRLAPQLMGL